MRHRDVAAHPVGLEDTQLEATEADPVCDLCPISFYTETIL